MEIRHTFPKSMRLTHKRDIDRLYNNACVIKQYPLKLMVRFEEPSASNNAFKIVLSVPKRLHRKAVSRNLIKRRMKESFRQSNADLNAKLNENKKVAHLMLVYISKHIATYAEIDTAWKAILADIDKEISK